MSTEAPATTTAPGPVNLYQLALALGDGSIPFAADGNLLTGPVTITTTAVDQATLDAAVAGHVADPTVQPPVVAPTLDPNAPVVIPAAAWSDFVENLAGATTLPKLHSALTALASAVPDL